MSEAAEHIDPFDRLLRSLGANLARIRAKAGMTQEAIAERIDVHPRYYQRVEAGVQPITLRTLVRLASALEVDPRDLLRKPRTRTAQPKSS